MLSRRWRLSLGGADLHVSGCHTHQGNEYIVVTSDGSQEPAVGGFDGAAQFTPDIQFPGCLNAKLVRPIGVRDKVVRQRYGDPVISQRRAELLLLRIELADRDAKPRACFQYPYPGGSR
jgi:hypothetical protein